MVILGDLVLLHKIVFCLGFCNYFSKKVKQKIDNAVDLALLFITNT